MDILLMNGSPKKGESASMALLQILKNYLKQDEIQELECHEVAFPEEALQQLTDTDVLVLAFPLYIDSIPSHLLRCLAQAQTYVKLHGSGRIPRVYGIVNNGFFDGKQNQYALESLGHWSRSCGFTYAGGIGLGGGGMVNSVKMIPGEHGPKKNMAMALKKLSQCILAGESMESLLIEMSYPEDLYRTQAESSWRKMAMDNGLKLNELGKEW